MKSILIIDDNKEFADSLQEALEYAGYKATVAYNGLEGLEALNNMGDLPSLIILDVVMPIMSGLEFRMNQLSNNKLANVDIIFLTAKNSYRDCKEELKAFEFLNKPVEFKDLLYTIETYFYLNRPKTICVSQT